MAGRWLHPCVPPDPPPSTPGPCDRPAPALQTADPHRRASRPETANSLRVCHIMVNYTTFANIPMNLTISELGFRPTHGMTSIAASILNVSNSAPQRWGRSTSKVRSFPYSAKQPGKMGTKCPILMGIPAISPPVPPTPTLPQETPSSAYAPSLHAPARNGPRSAILHLDSHADLPGHLGLNHTAPRRTPDTRPPPCAPDAPRRGDWSRGWISYRPATRSSLTGMLARHTFRY